MARDKFAKERIGDPPNVGYATASEKEISDMIMFFVREIERERPLLLEIVIAGREKWITRASNSWGVKRLLSNDKLGEIYDYMARLAGPDPELQLKRLAGIGLTA